MIDNEERKQAVHEAFTQWVEERCRGVEREAQDRSFVSAWATRAWLADGRRETMGRELDKLQQRIGRQRKANREQLRRNRELSDRVDELAAALRYYADPENYLDFEDNLGAKARAALSGGEQPKDNRDELSRKHGELVNKSFGEGLTNEEWAEKQRIEAALTELDEAFYGPTIKNLQDAVDRLSGGERKEGEA